MVLDKLANNLVSPKRINPIWNQSIVIKTMLRNQVEEKSMPLLTERNGKKISHPLKI